MAKCLLDNNKELINKFIECISLSLNIEQSCQATGIDYTTIYKYIQIAEKEIKEAKKEEREISEKKLKYVEFFKEFKKAEMSFVTRNVAIIQKASAKGSWQASAWLLERRLPKMFALRKEDEVEKGSKAVEVKVTFEDTANEKSEDELEAQVKKELK